MTGRAPRGSISASNDDKGWSMWWAVGGFLALIWITMLVFFGIETLRKGHWAMFFIGIVFPILWVMGAPIGPTARAQEAGAV
jgi:hypothetical protein